MPRNITRMRNSSHFLLSLPIIASHWRDISSPFPAEFLHPMSLSAPRLRSWIRPVSLAVPRNDSLSPTNETGRNIVCPRNIFDKLSMGKEGTRGRHGCLEGHENYVGTEPCWETPILPRWAVACCGEWKFIYEAMTSILYYFSLRCVSQSQFSCQLQRQAWLSSRNSCCPPQIAIFAFC
jgi:hypothetical protein